MKNLLAAALLWVPIWSLSLSSGAEAAGPPNANRHPGWAFKAAREIPIQGGGRVKPLDSFAREVSLFETGSRTFEGWDPVDMLFSQLSQPDAWETYPFIQIGREDVRRQLGIDEKRTRFSPRELMDNAVLAQYAMTGGRQAQVSAPIATAAKMDAREQEFRRVFERLGLFRRVVSGEAWTLVPTPPAKIEDTPNPWASVADHGDAMSGATSQGNELRLKFIELVRGFQTSNEAKFDEAAVQVGAIVRKMAPGFDAYEERKLSAESVYNRSRPFLLAWILYVCAALTWISSKVGAPRAQKHIGRIALLLTVSGLLVHAVGFGLRCFIAGRPPVTNMYESIVWVSLGQLVFAAILYAIHRQRIIFIVSTVLGAIGLIVADSAPAVMDPGIHPLVPVLRSNYWLTIHVLTITLGYAAFALTLGLANVSLFYFLRAHKKGYESEAKKQIASMNQLTYRAMQFGVVLLAAGTILGGVWADYSWGRFWGWDPKEVWALIALLCYLVILHGRYAGWVAQFGFAAWSVVSFLSVVMAWYGVNFVLGVGLHSYGFASGGFVPIATFVTLQLAYVGWVGFVYKRGAKASV